MMVESYIALIAIAVLVIGLAIGRADARYQRARRIQRLRDRGVIG
jgi:hypothetical protein